MVLKNKKMGNILNYLWLKCFFNCSAWNCFGGAVCTIGKTYTKLLNKDFVYW